MPYPGNNPGPDSGIELPTLAPVSDPQGQGQAAASTAIA
jgi:hypothetical protein